MRKDSIYYKQVQLLVRVLPLIDTEKCFALKGGSAINLFYRPMPRLSVDIDLLYLPSENRQEAIRNIRSALSRLSALISKSFHRVQVQNVFEQTDTLRILLNLDGIRIKVELSPVIRESVFPIDRMEICKEAEREFGYAEIQVASLSDVYAGKICAALECQHPRDLFDVKLLLENEGFNEDLRKTFLVFLISHQRPISELLAPHLKDIRGIYSTEFAQMTALEVQVDELENTRKELIDLIPKSLTLDEKNFLISFKKGKPQWDLLGFKNIDNVIQLPSVNWKLQNLLKMDGKKNALAVEKLQNVLFRKIDGY